MAEPSVFRTELVDQAVSFVKERWPQARPKCALILGSGWGGAISTFNIRDSIAYSEIPGFGAALTPGHEGRLHWAECSGIETLLLQGRRHWHEGCGWMPVIVPIYLLSRIGAKVLMLTGSVGGIRSDLKPGDLMAVADHINLMGSNPFSVIPPLQRGEDFIDLTNLYDTRLRVMMLNAAESAKERLSSGILAATAGPLYETPAEVRMLSYLGADACGMSVVPEAVLGHSLGLEVVSCVCITNFAAGLDGKPRTHQEVLETAGEASQRASRILASLWKLLAQSGSNTGAD